MEWFEDVPTSDSILADTFPDFEVLHSKIASGLRNIITGQVKRQEGKTQAEGRFLTERHISWMIFKNFTICGEAIQDFGELIKLQLTSGSVQLFDTKWDKIKSTMTERLAANLLERLDSMQLEKSDGLLYLMSVYNPETKQYPYECAKLRNFFQRHIEQKNISHLKKPEAEWRIQLHREHPPKGKRRVKTKYKTKSRSHRRLHTLDSKRFL